MVLPVPSSNMILLVLDTLCPLPSSVPTLTTWPVQHDYNASLACHKVHNVELPRRRPLTCINKHANVSFAQHDIPNELITPCLFTGKYNRTLRPGEIARSTDGPHVRTKRDPARNVALPAPLGSAFVISSLITNGT